MSKQVTEEELAKRYLRMREVQRKYYQSVKNNPEYLKRNRERAAQWHEDNKHSPELKARKIKAAIQWQADNPIQSNQHQLKSRSSPAAKRKSAERSMSYYYKRKEYLKTASQEERDKVTLGRRIRYHRLKAKKAEKEKLLEQKKE